jgi:hypothetical protein
MPVADHPVSPMTSFVEVPLSSCHSSKPDLTRQSYLVMNLSRTASDLPYHDVVRIKWFSDGKCKQPVGTTLPECRGCTTPQDLLNR